jgi:DNA polymerase-1
MTTTFERGEPVAIALADGVGAALVGTTSSVEFHSDEMLAEIARLEREHAPRWIWWTRETAAVLVAAGIRPARCWDIDAVHRLLHGGWRSGPGRSWASTHGLDPNDMPTSAPPDLFSVDDAGDADAPIRPDGHLQPTWIDERWCSSSAHLRQWAELAHEVFAEQTEQFSALAERPAAVARRHHRGS